MWSLYPRVCVCMYMCVYVYVCVCMYASMCLYMCVCVGMCVCMVLLISFINRDISFQRNRCQDEKLFLQYVKVIDSPFYLRWFKNKFIFSLLSVMLKVAVLTRSQKLSRDELFPYLSEWPISNNRFCEQPGTSVSAALVELRKCRLHPTES